MLKALISSTAVIAALQAAPASAAITLLDTDCDLTTGCLFSGNITDESPSVTEMESAYNRHHIEPPLPATIDLTGLYMTSGSLGGLNGTFTLPGGGLFDFYAVKAGNEFMLYQVTSTNSVSWSTAGLLNNQGRPREASHITAFSSVDGAVPEPSTWAMMLFGFGAVGYAMRRRKHKLTISHA